MNLIYLALLCGLIATSFIHKSEAKLHTESIIEGNVATVEQHTYSVSIQIDYFHICGGGILSNLHIITAAHCFMNPETNKFENRKYLVVAAATRAHNEYDQYRVTREIAKIYIPREFNFVGNKFSDIAVIELHSGLGLNHLINNVFLPPIAGPHLTYEHQQAVVCGYGHNFVTIRHNPLTHEEVEFSTGCYERRFAVVNIISNMACRNIYRELLDSHLCGHLTQRSPTNPEGLCTGDSGAPLVIGNTIIGVVSSSPKGCREDLEPAIYTRVTSFIPFITEAMHGVQAANMRLAKFEVVECGLLCKKKVLVEL